MPKGIPKNEINKGWIKRGNIPWNKNIKGVMIAWNKGKKLSKEHIENLKKSHIGYKMPEKQKKKISKSLRGNPNLTWMKGKKRTEESRRKQGESISGKNHWKWKGGMDFIKDIRNSVEYKLWRKSNLERDNFTCQKCNQYGGKFQIHHINNFADFPDKRFAIDNGITFCSKCHQNFHKRYGRKNNTKEQLKEFLLN